MRGRRGSQTTMVAFVDLEERVPNDHPLRTIKAVADEALERLSPKFDRMYLGLTNQRAQIDLRQPHL
ncbi:MAG: hypothetical protein OXD46_09530 [Chloroflexi bacterium]|nr:hypothetical protein [Chloroflexota bacterium]